MDYPSTSGDHNYSLDTPIKSRVDVCFVPMCPSTSTKFRNKLFLTGPSDPKLRKKWFQAVKRVDSYSPKTIIRCCEDHFDLENDIENWMKFKMMGGKLFLKKGVVPHIFACQNRMMPLKPRSAVMKRKRREILESIDNTSETHDSQNIEISNDKSVQLSIYPYKRSKQVQVERKIPQRTVAVSGLRIALVQMPVGPDKSKNVATAVKEIHSAKAQGAQLVALPECFNCPYGTEYFEQYAEEVPGGETMRALSRAAAAARVCVVGGTVPERRGARLYNTCAVWDASGQLIAQHRKMHLFDIDIPGKITFRESDVLSPGDQLTTFEFCGVKIGLGICYDLRFYEMAHLMAMKGCSLLIYPGAFNTTTGPKHWELLGRARAADLQLWVALASPARAAAGHAGYAAWGHSLLADPWGAVRAQLDEGPGTLLADIDLDVVEEVRSQIPIRKQRRTDIYDTVTVVKTEENVP